MDGNIKEEELEIYEELKTMAEKLSSLDEIQRKEYLIKEYENFLKEINTIELLQRIKRFRRLNISSMNESEIVEAINTVLSWNDKFMFLPNLGNYPKSTKFYRVRKMGKTLIDIELKKGDFWEPPKENVKVRGRLNKEGEPLLYVTPEDPFLAIDELNIENGEWYILIRYKAIDGIKVNVIGGDYDYPQIGITDERAIENCEIITNFLNDEFSRNVGIGTEYLYKTSEIIAKWYFDLPPEEMQDAWAYISVHDKHKYNVCFRPENAHKKLELEGALICRKSDKNIINVYHVALVNEEDNNVLYFPLGSEEQKRVFPEVQMN